MNKWIALLLCSLALGLAVIGCGDDDEDEGSADTATTEQPADTGTTGATGGAGAGSKAKVGIKNIRFVPEDVKVKVGDTVQWTNTDNGITHTVTKEGGPGAKFDSGNLADGKSFEVKFTEPGEIAYVCTIHPNQTGTVTVE